MSQPTTDAVQLVSLALIRGRLVLASTTTEWVIAEPTIRGQGDDPFTLHINGELRLSGDAFDVAHELVKRVGADTAREAAASALIGTTDNDRLPISRTHRASRTG